MLANIIEEEIILIMRRPITYAELLLLLVLVPLGWIGSTHLYEYVTDRITICLLYTSDAADE